MGDPHAEYTGRLATRRETVAGLVRREERISLLRLGCMVAAGVLAWLAFRHHMLSPAWVLVPLAGFAVLVARHWDATAARQRAERAVAFYRRGLDRLEGTWMGGGEAGRALPRCRRIPTPTTSTSSARLALRAPLHGADAAPARTTLAALAARAGPARRDPRAPGGGRRAAPPPRPARGPGAPRRGRPRRGRPGRAARWARGADRSARAVAHGTSAPRLAVAALAGCALWASRPASAAAGRGVIGARGGRSRSRLRGRACCTSLRHVDAARPSTCALLAELLGAARARALQRAAARSRSAEAAGHATASRRRGGSPGCSACIDLLDARPQPALRARRARAALDARSSRSRSRPGARVRARACRAGSRRSASSRRCCALAGYAVRAPRRSVPGARGDGPPLLDGRGLGHPLLPAGRCVRNDVRLGGDAPRVWS